MLSKFSRFLTFATITTLTCVIAHPSSAQVENSPQKEEMEIVNPRLNVDRLIDQAFWQNSGDFFEQATILGQMNTIFGWRSFPQGSFPENNNTKDTLLTTTIVQDYFYQLSQREPTIRTKDFPNPFNTSLRKIESSTLIEKKQ